MKDEERKMLTDIHSALFTVPAGSSKDAQPLITKIRALVTAYERASWAARGMVWAAGALVALFAWFGDVWSMIPWSK